MSKQSRQPADRPSPAANKRAKAAKSLNSAAESGAGSHTPKGSKSAAEGRSVVLPSWDYELANGAPQRLVCGIDEAGRGALAGPVVAAAVILPYPWFAARLNDSKKLTAAARTQIYQELCQHPQVHIGVGRVEAQEIDRINILQASWLAMRLAFEQLGGQADFALIDGLPIGGLDCAQQAIVKGDALSLSIAAASIVAKVTRDNIMLEMEQLYPGYGLGKHKGYGTLTHRKALLELGPSACHRLSFAPCRQQDSLELEF